MTMTKTWVWSGAANSRHGGVANETVPVYQPFSNGGDYPGDFNLGTEQTAGCRCDLDVFETGEFSEKSHPRDPQEMVHDLVLHPDGQRMVDDGLAAIRQVHKVPSTGRQLVIRDSDEVLAYDSRAKEILVKSDGPRADAAAITHEYGHHLADDMFGGVNDALSSAEMAGVRSAIEDTAEWRLWAEEGSRSFTSDAELWARAYEQWISTRALDGKLLGFLENAPQHRGMYAYWSARSFEPIAKQFDEVFRARGLLSAD